jgi:hypothetical protein
MRRLTFALALAALGAAATLAHTQPALASSSPTLSAGDDGGSTSAMCGQGIRIECGDMTTVTCLAWGTAPDGSTVCTFYVTKIVKTYRN